MPHTTSRTRTKCAHTTAFMASLTLASLLVAGCKSPSAATPENFTTGLNAHFLDHPDCLFTPAPRFPYETGDAAEIKRMNTLVTSKLLDVSSEVAIRVSRYTPTTVGARYAPRFCFGHRVIASIDSFTPPKQANGFPETQIVYHYTVEDVPMWAKDTAVQAAFPVMAHATSGTATDTITMAGTMTGWQVPD
jgi:hypothetical protein